jgi:hypothetical protein
MGYQWPDQGTGWDITALSDVHPEYRGSCGVCYEIKCENKGMRDGYGEWIDRNGVCKARMPRNGVGGVWGTGKGGACGH